ncbi:MAG: ABC transporter substrate-binding protein [Steroidobacterales bacterium]
MFARRLPILLCALALAVPGGFAAAAEAGPQAVPQSLYDALLKVMKQGPALGFAGRVKALEPELRRDYDLAFMTRVVVGPPWRSMSPEEQQGLVAAFSDYTFATYASRFKDYSGERFTVDPGTSTLPSGDTIVHTKLVPHDGDPVELDYLMRAQPEGLRIIDVLLNGTVSEMAERRSEYSSTLRDGGAAALIRMLQQKTAALAN